MFGFGIGVEWKVGIEHQSANARRGMILQGVDHDGSRFESKRLRANPPVESLPLLNWRRAEPDPRPRTRIHPNRDGTDLLLQREAVTGRRHEALVHQHETGADGGMAGKDHLARRREDPDARHAVGPAGANHEGCL